MVKSGHDPARNHGRRGWRAHQAPRSCGLDHASRARSRHRAGCAPGGVLQAALGRCGARARDAAGAARSRARGRLSRCELRRADLLLVRQRCPCRSGAAVRLQVLRGNGLEVHLATVQDHERAAYLWDRLDFRSRFDGLHYAAALGCSKPSPAFYRAIEAATRLAPEAIFFIDDRPENVEGARACGWTAALWTGADTLDALIGRERWPLA